MNKHLSKYLTSKSPSLRAWVKARINRTDQRFEVIEKDIEYIPTENQYVCGAVYIPKLRSRSLGVKVLFCETLYCEDNQLTKLPDLPICEVLYCWNNQLTKLPNLPVCEILSCSNNQLTVLPDLPVCKKLLCQNNKLRELPKLPVCEVLYCYDNQLTKLPDLPICEILYWEANPGTS